MQSRKFTLEDQMNFARLSGDHNPWHVDEIAARRMLFGSTVVHGIHSLLWGLDQWLENTAEPVEICSVKASFLKPIRVGEELIFSFNKLDDKKIRIELHSEGSIVTRIEATWVRSKSKNAGGIKLQFPEKGTPKILTESQVEKARGTLDLFLEKEAATDMFPNLMRCVSKAPMAVLLATTRLVGMECPGLRSVYSELCLSIGDFQKTAGLNYEVTKLDRRFGLVLMRISALGMEGAINSFIRPEIQQQDSYTTLKNLVKPNEFKGQKALIVGGSRGLGEVAAKLLAAGGADVKITYYKGEHDARRFVDDIITNGGMAESCHLDVLDDQTDLTSRIGSLSDFTHLYYFATPPIAGGAKKGFSKLLFQKFCEYYVNSFERIVGQVSRGRLQGVFYPSSVSVDELPSGMVEYTMAKIAGETLCAFIEKSQKNITFYKPRLPRMATDLTVSIMPIHVQKPETVMIMHLRSFCEACLLMGKNSSEKLKQQPLLVHNDI